VNGGNSDQANSRYRVSAPLRGLGLLAGPAFALLVALSPRPVCAQSRVSPTITVAPTVRAESASQVKLAIVLGPIGALPPQSFIRLHGLPPEVAVSDAYSIAPGSWAVALAALPNLKIILPAGVSGRSNIVITLVALDGTVLAEVKCVLDVAAPAQHQSERRTPAPPSDASMLRPATRIEASPGAAEPHGPAPPAVAAPPMAPRDLERAQRLMEKGNQELEGGNVSAARLFYEYAADVGLADAAMALAATFDASELAKLNVRGIAPNAKEAQRWYERARQLGAAEADQRVRRLSGQ
jgi:hypothetical protein